MSRMVAVDSRRARAAFDAVAPNLYRAHCRARASLWDMCRTRGARRRVRESMATIIENKKQGRRYDGVRNEEVEAATRASPDDEADADLGFSQAMREGEALFGTGAPAPAPVASERTSGIGGAWSWTASFCVSIRDSSVDFLRVVS